MAPSTMTRTFVFWLIAVVALLMANVAESQTPRIADRIWRSSSIVPPSVSSVEVLVGNEFLPPAADTWDAAWTGATVGALLGVAAGLWAKANAGTNCDGCPASSSYPILF